METVQDRLRQILKEKHVTARDLSARIGKSNNYVSQFLIGKNKNPSSVLFEYLESYYLVNLEWLFEGKGEMFLPGGGPGWTGSRHRTLLRKFAVLPYDQQKVIEQMVDLYTFWNKAQEEKEG